MSGTDLTLADYFEKYQIHDFLHVVEPSTTFACPKTYALHAGEIQAIALALEYKSILLIEEHAGRQVAQYLDIPFSGIAGQILQAYRQKHINILQTKAAWLRLKQTGRIGQNLHQKLLETV
jgi:predicted nucleic acid-binding protein